MKNLAIAYQITILSGLTFGLITAYKFKQKTNVWIFAVYIALDLVISAICIYTGQV